MLPEYALNMTNGKLHAACCYHAKESAVRTVSVTLLPVFRKYGNSISCCQICLKNDEKAKSAVEKWNHEFEHYK